eukprot:m.249213 g.249213  ORF g.249213 m.249213 type:complete len:404 (-) comp54497_c0_seq12:83-1294(-)
MRLHALLLLAAAAVSIEKVEGPIILWWTTPGGMDIPTPVPLEYHECPYKCLKTTNKDYLSHDGVVGVVFYGTGFGEGQMPLPRTQNHAWALFHDESPMNNWKLIYRDVIQHFNFTTTYSEGATWPIPMQWAPTEEELLVRKATFAADKSQDSLAPAIYVQSNCMVPSDRTRYISELMKYIKVDSYGQCLKNKNFTLDTLGNFFGFDDKEFYDLIGQYKFTLSFENAICEGYMTEKLWRPLQSGSVPVYFGAPNAKDYVPDHSVIFVNEFESPKALGIYLNYLNENDEAYNEYLAYRSSHARLAPFQDKNKKRNYRSYLSNDHRFPGMTQRFDCELCSALHNIDPAHPHVADRSHYPCDWPTESFPFQEHETTELQFGYGPMRWIRSHDMVEAEELLARLKANQ